MSHVPPPFAVAQQQSVDAHFGRHFQEWRDLYEENTLFGVIHQTRLAIAISWVEALNLPSGARILDIGCGAGVLAIRLARSGYAVDCIDTSEAMVDLTRRHAAVSGVAERLTVGLGNAHAIPCASGSYDVVVALGVVPFLHSPAEAIAEMARATSADGHLLLTSDNRWRLNRLLDPRLTPLLDPLKNMARDVCPRVGQRERGMRINRFSCGSFVQLLERAGLEVEKCTTLGFGPFTLLGRPLLSEETGIKLHRLLQHRANQSGALLRSTAAQHLVLARKREPW